MKLAIIGMGVVGRAQAQLFDMHDLVTYDPAQDSKYPVKQIADCECAIICVGTPPLPDGSADLSQLRGAIATLPAGLPVLLRSTVPPGTTDELREQRGSAVCFCPEFLHERKGGSWPASADVPYTILGGKDPDRPGFRHLLLHAYGRRRQSYVHECTAMEAELAKYTANLYWAARVTFVSEMAQIAKTMGVDWENVRRAWTADFRVSSAYTYMDGFEPGFSGACWPKDLSAIIRAASGAGYEPEFLESIQEANERFRG
jgi:nucleotide sugar dehydrogenase